MTRRALCVVLFAIGLSGCGGKDNGGTDPGGIDAPGTPVDANPDGVIVPSDGPGGGFECFVTECDNHISECGDCEDNDGDGEVDSRDRECLGPCDNTEGPTLEPGVGGTTSANCKMECFFDYGDGAGNDGCVWDHRCDSLEPRYVPGECAPGGGGAPNMNECNAWQAGNYASHTMCLSVCEPITPNGCDCFGCCTFTYMVDTNAVTRNIYIGSLDSSNEGTCSYATIANTTACPSCTKVESCGNPCGECEICIDRPTLPPGCTGGEQCPGGEQPCGQVGQADCPAGSYCITGCCQAQIP